jgi:hypothetical protein
VAAQGETVRRSDAKVDEALSFGGHFSDERLGFQLYGKGRMARLLAVLEDLSPDEASPR